MFRALKPGFRSLAGLQVVVNVVGELQREKNSWGIARLQHGFIDCFRVLTYTHYTVNKRPTRAISWVTRTSNYGSEPNCDSVHWLCLQRCGADGYASRIERYTWPIKSHLRGSGLTCRGVARICCRREAGSY